jgi:glyoxylase-like metal-dependent hydrolase (beta-lactamase superfamily II)/8-oxo-dGTP pyrophosphatase MutT (NUDIX family)
VSEPRLEPVEARPAATVVLMRPGRGGPEVLLGRRPASMAFAPDVHVFPGGRVDPTDAHPSLVARSVVSPEDAAAALGGVLPPTEAIAAFIAAIRESFEEAGVLLADVGPHSFPGALGAARAALVGGEIGFQALAAQLDLTLRTDWLVPLSRWVTPSNFPRRFDARFFAAELPEGAKATLEGDEVVEHAWLRPRDALQAMAAGEFALWLPTSTTLQQLEHVDGFDTVRSRLAPGPLGVVEVDELDPEVVRIVMPAGGGVAGQPVNAYLVGRHSFVLVDPGDPTGPGLDRAIDVATERGGTIRAVALTHVDPDHAAGAEALAEQLDIEVLVGPGGGRPLPYAARELADGEVIDAGDVPLRVIGTPGPRADHMAFVVGAGVVTLTGDLDGVRGARSITGPGDDAAWNDSMARLDAAAPKRTTRLGGHPQRS